MWSRTMLVIAAIFLITPLITHTTIIHHLTPLKELSTTTYIISVGNGVIVVGTGHDDKVTCVRMDRELNVEWTLTLGRGRVIASISPDGKYLALSITNDALTNVTVVNTLNGSVLRFFTLHASVDRVEWADNKHLVLTFKEGGAGHWELSIYDIRGEKIFTTSSLGLGFSLGQSLMSGDTVAVLNSSLSINTRSAYVYVVGEGTHYLGKGVAALALSPSGSLIAMLKHDGDGTYLEVEQVRDNHVILSEFLGNVSEGVVEFSQDGRYVATAYGSEGSELLEVFSLSNGSSILRVTVLEGEPLVDFISWSPNSKYILVRGVKELEVLGLNGKVVLGKVIVGDVDKVFWFPNHGRIGLIVEDETMGYDYFMLLSLSGNTVLKAVNGGVIDEYFLSKPPVLGLVFKDGTADIISSNGSVIKVKVASEWHARHVLLKYGENNGIQAILTYSSGKSVSVGEVLINVASSLTSTRPHTIPARNADFILIFVGLSVIIIAGAAFLITFKQRRGC